MNSKAIISLMAMQLFTFMANAKATDCSVAAPKPMLISSSYPKSHGYKFKITDAQENRAEESVRVGGVTQLTILSSGCVDQDAKEFHILRNDPVGPGKPEMSEILYLQKYFVDLKVVPAEKKRIERLLKFLGSQKVLRNISICKNGTQPTQDGCGFETGGEYSLKFKVIAKTPQKGPQTEFNILDLDTL